MKFYQHVQLNMIKIRKSTKIVQENSIQCPNCKIKIYIKFKYSHHMMIKFFTDILKHIFDKWKHDERKEQASGEVFSSFSFQFSSSNKIKTTPAFFLTALSQGITLLVTVSFLNVTDATSLLWQAPKKHSKCLSYVLNHGHPLSFIILP